MAKFPEFLAGLVANYHGTKGELARALKVHPSKLSRFLRAGSPPPPVEICLLVAEATGAMPSKVLREAGKGEIAEVIEGLYGLPAERRQAFLAKSGTLDPFEEKLIAKVRRLDSRGRQAVAHMVDALLNVSSPHARTKRRQHHDHDEPDKADDTSSHDGDSNGNGRSLRASMDGSRDGQSMDPRLDGGR